MADLEYSPLMLEDMPLEEMAEESPLMMGEHNENLVKFLQEDELTQIARTVIDGYTYDKQSRQEWENIIDKGMDLLGLDLKTGNEPFAGACNAVLPVILESAVKFQSKAIQEAFPAQGPVKTTVRGKKTPEKEVAAQRVKEFMNYQLTELMTEYFDDHERMLVYLAITGMAVKKTYYDPYLERPVSEFIPIDQFDISYYANSLEGADRYTHTMFSSENKYLEDVTSGKYVKANIGKPSQPEISKITATVDKLLGLNQPIEDQRYTFLEQHTNLRLSIDSDNEPAPPYLITVDLTSRKVLSIYRNWLSDDRKKKKLLWFTIFKYVPWFGFYSLGLLHLIGSLTKTGTVALRALVDAGQFATLQGGFKARGLRVFGDNSPLKPGEWRDAEATGMDLGRALVPINYKEPSQTLLALLEMMNGMAQKFADSTEMVVGDASSYGPVGTIMALLDASTKFFSAIHKRIHASQRKEYKIIYNINSWYLPAEYPYEVEGGDRVIFQQDFGMGVDISPVSDPNIPSQTHRLALAQLKLQIAQQHPDIHDMREALGRVYRAIEEPDIDKILPPPQSAQPADPLTDIQSATKGIPISAFMGQNHEAHIAVKSAFLQDPANGANPIMQKVANILLANVQEHVTMKFVEQVQGIIEEAAKLNPQMINQEVIEKIMGEAAKEILKYNAAHANEEAGNIEEKMYQLNKEQLELEKVKHEDNIQLDLLGLESKDRDRDLKAQQLEVDAAKEGIKIKVDVDEKEKDRKMDLTKIVSDLFKEKMRVKNKPSPK